MKNLIKIAWFVYFPVEWLPDLPESLRASAKRHPASWQRVFLEQLEERDDVELHIFVIRSLLPCSVVFKRGKTTFHCLKTPGGLRAASLFWLDTLLLRRELKRIQPDLVHAWGTENAAALIASRLPYPALVTMQGIMTWYPPPKDKYGKLIRFLEPISLRRAKILTTESRFAVDYLHQRYPNAEIFQAEHASGKEFHDMKRIPQTDPVRLLFVGHLSHRKGGDLLLRAAHAALAGKRFEIIVIGHQDAEMTRNLKSELPPGFWDQIHFMKDLTPVQVAGQMSQATLLIQPTRADTSPNSVKEAAVSGLPVIASDTGGIPDYIVPGRNGLLFPPGDLDALTNRIREAIQHPLFGLGKVDEAVQARVRAYLSPKRMGELFWIAYHRAMDMDRHPKPATLLHFQETPSQWAAHH